MKRAAICSFREYVPPYRAIAVRPDEPTLPPICFPKIEHPVATNCSWDCFWLRMSYRTCFLHPIRNYFDTCSNIPADTVRVCSRLLSILSKISRFRLPLETIVETFPTDKTKRSLPSRREAALPRLRSQPSRLVRYKRFWSFFESGTAFVANRSRTISVTSKMRKADLINRECGSNQI